MKCSDWITIYYGGKTEAGSPRLTGTLGAHHRPSLKGEIDNTPVVGQTRYKPDKPILDILNYYAFPSFPFRTRICGVPRHSYPPDHLFELPNALIFIRRAFNILYGVDTSC